jgi:type IV pilus biogenesis protein CpaD/CtpE
MAGCSGANYLDPYQKPYTWHPSGAPAANLAAQLANPHDLVSGRGSAEGDTKDSTLAIERVWQDRPKQIGEGGSSGGTGASGAGAGASAGGTN